MLYDWQTGCIEVLSGFSSIRRRRVFCVFVMHFEIVMMGGGGGGARCFTLIISPENANHENKTQTVTNECLLSLWMEYERLNVKILF